MFLKVCYRVGQAKTGDSSVNAAAQRKGSEALLFLVASELIDACESCGCTSSGRGFCLHDCGRDLRRRRTEEPSLIFVPASLPGLHPANMSNISHMCCCHLGLDPMRKGGLI